MFAQDVGKVGSDMLSDEAKTITSTDRKKRVSQEKKPLGRPPNRWEDLQIAGKTSRSLGRSNLTRVGSTPEDFRKDSFGQRSLEKCQKEMREDLKKCYAI